MNKLSTDAYSFTVSLHPQSGVLVLLTQRISGKEQEFYVASGGLDAMTYHMNSLTDDQCNEWFKPKRVKKRHE